MLMKRIAALILFVFTFIAFAFSQTATLTATTNSTKVALGSYLQVTYTLKNGSAESFVKPAFKNFSVTGQYMSSGGGMTMYINGKKMNTDGGESTWTYTLIPTATGKFTIDAAKAKVNGAWISSNTLTIEVSNSGGSSATKPSSSQSSNTTTTTADVNDADIFIKAVADKANPYMGEQVIVTYKLYTRINVSQLGIDKLASYTGFWSNEITKKDDKPVQYKETIGGSEYVVAEIRKVALFPQKSGVLKINPLEVECVVQVKSKQKYNDPFADLFNDPFFNNFSQNIANTFFDTYSNQKKTIKSNALTFNVKALPTANQPSDFNNAVGSFTLNSTIDKTSAKTNDAIKLTYTIKGSGNINLIDKPTIEFPPDLETFDPEEKENVSTTAAGVSGTKSFEYILIPRSPGEFTIPSWSFSYFDLASKTYKTLTTPEYSLKIAKGSDAENTVSTSKEDIKYLNNDVRYLKNAPLLFHQTGSYFYSSWLFFGMMVLPFLVFLIFIFVYRKRIEERSNIALMKNKKATAVALKRLKTAGMFLEKNNKEAFLDETFKALWGYLSDKLGIPQASLSKETVSEAFELKHVDSSIVEKFIGTIDLCEYARFAPDDGDTAMQNIYNQALEIISTMERELR
jgi:hypothetical protein